jgi:hypothetical protein
LGVVWNADHALAVGRDAFGENGIAEFLEVFFGVVGGGAFEEEGVEVRHCAVGCLFIGEAVGSRRYRGRGARASKLRGSWHERCHADCEHFYCRGQGFY